MDGEFGIGLVDELQERFSDRINDLEAVVREIAIDITTGTLMERLQPKRIWERAGERVTLVAELLRELREYLSIMKPERVPTIQRNVSSISQRLTLFKETLEMDSLDPLDSSRKALEELRQALVEISDFLSLCKEVKETPSPVISSVLSLKGSRVYEVPFETWAKLEHLAEMIKSTQLVYEDISELTSRMENQLDAIRSEYENLMFSFRKEEEKES